MCSSNQYVLAGCPIFVQEETNKHYRIVSKRNWWGGKQFVRVLCYYLIYFQSAISDICTDISCLAYSQAFIARISVGIISYTHLMTRLNECYVYAVNAEVHSAHTIYMFSISYWSNELWTNYSGNVLIVLVITSKGCVEYYWILFKYAMRTNV